MNCMLVVDRTCVHRSIDASVGRVGCRCCASIRSRLPGPTPRAPGRHPPTDARTDGLIERTDGINNHAHDRYRQVFTFVCTSPLVQTYVRIYDHRSGPSDGRMISESIQCWCVVRQKRDRIHSPRAATEAHARASFVRSDRGSRRTTVDTLVILS